MACHSIQVSCRVRDASSDSAAAGDRVCVSVGDDAQTIEVHAPVSTESSGSSNNNTATTNGSCYSCFDCVFSGKATQEAVFESVGRPFVDDLLAGYNCTVLAYGQTGSGKTYTTVGSNYEDSDARGLIPRALERIFQQVERSYEGSEPAQMDDVKLTASFIEVYQESLRDLLMPHNSSKLRIREDKQNGVYVENASEISISSVASGMALLARGNAQRSTGATLMNADSNRSHCVFTLTVTQRNMATRDVRKGKLLFVDLAGSEKASKTAASGKRLDEAKHINRSLSALGNVINALTDGKATYVPYRGSKLTRLLQSSLGGNAKTHLLLTCSSSALHVHETLSTLRFGARAKRIVNAPHVNNEKSTSAGEYQELLSTLQAKMCALLYDCVLSNAKIIPLRTNSHVCFKLADVSVRVYAATFGVSRPHKCVQTAEGRIVIKVVHKGLGTPRTAAHSPNSPMELYCIAMIQPRSSSSSSSNLVENPYRLADDLMQEELNSLRRALAEMQCDRHEAEHARHLANTILQVSHAEGEALCHTQAEKMQQQEVALEDAQVTIASLERQVMLVHAEKLQLDATCAHLRLEVRHLKDQQTQSDEAQSAEGEILRRRLACFEKHAKKAQMELLASQKLQEELRSRLVAKEQSLQHLKEESASLHFRLAQAFQSAPKLHSPTPSPLKQTPMSRPFTAVGDLGSSNISGSGMGNIQSWWSGVPEVSQQQSKVDIEFSGYGHQPAQQSERRKTNSTKLVVVTGSLGSEVEASSMISQSDAIHRGEERRCRSQGAQTRPFRARLVGLLNSLEEETSSLKELISESTREANHSLRPAAARAGKQRHLPCLEPQNAGG